MPNADSLLCDCCDGTITTCVRTHRPLGRYFTESIGQCRRGTHRPEVVAETEASWIYYESDLDPGYRYHILIDDSESREDGGANGNFWTEPA